MAVIGSIRKRSGLLLTIIGLALVAFIVGDFLKRNRGPKNVNVGEVAGEVIPYKEFNQAFERNAEYVKNQQRKGSLNSQERSRVQQQTWDQLVRQIIMDKEFADLGINVTTDELKDMISGPNPHPALVQSFSNPQTGEYDPKLVLNYLSQLPTFPVQQQQQWANFENSLKEERKNTKFQNLISKAYYTPKALAKMFYSDEKTEAKVSYVAARYSDVSDSLVNIAEADYQKYYDKNKALYEQEDSRDLQYLVFRVSPSAEDKGKLAKEMNAIYEDMKTVDPSRVASFVNANSDVKYDSTWLRKAQIPAEADQIITEGNIGAIVKPYFKNSAFYINELVAKEMRSDSLKASHILIAYKGGMRANPDVTRTSEEAKKLADSLATVIKANPKKFDELAKSESDGPSASKAGDLGWFTDGAMVPKFNSYVQNNTVGSIGVVETSFGYHIIKVTDKKDPQPTYRLATIERKLLASDKTYQARYQDASSFAVKARTYDGFISTIEEEGLNMRDAKKVKTTSAYIPGIKSPREIIRWAFNEKTTKGSVSNVFEDEDKYVVVAVADAYAKGIPALAEIKDRIKPFIVNEKKGEYLAEKMNSTDLNTVASAVSSKVDEVNSLKFADRNFPGFGMESKVIGAVFALPEGQVSKPVIGNAACFVVKADKLTPAPATEDYKTVVDRLNSDFQRRVSGGYVLKALEQNAEIVDNRIKFF
ncbi:MAG: peptidylprolyl isomerase [Bacteroidales bacterium]